MHPLTAAASSAVTESTLLDATQLDLLMLVLRLFAGVTIFVHGYNKMFRGGRIAGTAGWFQSMGMRPNGRVHAYLASLTEMGTGVLLVLGLLTPLGAAGVIGLMTVAGWTVHRHAFLIIKEGFEFVMILGALALAIGTVGPGRWSLDEVLDLRGTLNDGWAGFALSAGLGVLAGVALLLACYRPPAPKEG